MNEYIIRITGEYDIIVLTPQMIKTLIQKIHNSDTRELMIPESEILTRVYVEYLARVLSANFEMDQSKADIQAAYEMIANQINRLKVSSSNCFDEVCCLEENQNRQFSLNTNEKFYMLIKQKNPVFFYSYKDPYGKDIKLTLIYQ